MPHEIIADLPAGKVAELFNSTHASALHRREESKTRFQIDSESYINAIHDRIFACYRTQAAREAMGKYAALTINIQKRVTDRVAAPIYRVPPHRFLDGQSAKKNREWAEVLKEANIATKAKQWGRYAFLGNVCFVFPVVREFGAGKNARKQLRYEMVLPWTAEVLFSDDLDVDPAQPSILIYRVAEPALDTDGSGVVYKAVDAAGWFGLNGRGEVIKRYAEWDHGIPPFVAMRVGEPPPHDWWDRSRGAKLPEVTIEAGRIQASMHWIRKEQQRKLLVYKGMDDAIPEGTTGLPESSIDLFGEPGAVDLSAIDYETKADPFITEIRFLIEQAIEAYGLPSTMVDLVSGPGDAANSNTQALARNHAALSEVRDDQIHVMEQYERDLAWKTALQLRAGKHRIQPDPDKVRDDARIKWPPLTFTDHPLTRYEIYQKAIELGQMTHAQALMQEHPGIYMSEDDAAKQIGRNIESRNKVAALLAVHNTRKDPTEDQENTEAAMEVPDPEPGKEFQTIAQRFGAAGGRKSQRVDTRKE